VFDILADPVALVLRTIHSGLSEFLLPHSGPAWGLSIVFLTMTVRLLLFPLFVKQIKSQRRMQEIAPKVKELQKLHKGDRETLNTEMMKLYKDHGANPISGCLPLLLQLPVFFALFSVIREFKPGADPKYGMSAQLLEEGGRAKIFGAPISAAFNSPQSLLDELGGGALTVRLVAAVMVVLMGASTFYTQKQMMARAGTVTDPQQIMIQKIMLYVLPLSFAVSGVFFPIGVLLYWLTTNLWSMGQQAWVIKRMPPLDAVAAAKKLADREAELKTKAESRPSGSGSVVLTKGGGTATAVAEQDERSGASRGPAAGRPPSGRAAGNRKNKKKPRGGRR
jgi:YidC/Oxa1 family membrane protein insertase